MDQPLVSIIIPVYNNAADLSATIECAINQTWKNKEIIIVDDGSTDNSLAIARSYEKKLNSFIVVSVENGGAAKARNIGFDHSKGDYIQYLDADDLLVNNKIELQMIRLLKEQEVQNVISTGQWIKFNGSTDDTIGGVGPGGKAERDMSPLEWLLLRPYNLMTVHAWLTPRSVIERAGRWNESMSLDDDGDFFIRAVAASGRVVFCNGALSYYRTIDGKSSLSTYSKFTSSESNCNKLRSAYNSLESYRKAVYALDNRSTKSIVSENFLLIAFDSYLVCEDVYKKSIQQFDAPLVERVVYYKWRRGLMGILALLVGWRGAKQLTRAIQKIRH